MTQYDVGDVAHLSWRTYADDGVTLADPNTVVLTVTDPSGNDSTPSVTNDGVGLYSADVPLDEVGLWSVSWQGTGANAMAETDVLTVVSWGPVPVSLAEVKQYLNITVSTHDEELRRLLRTAAEAGERRTGRAFTSRAFTETVSLRVPSHRIVLPVTPVTMVTAVTENGTALSAGDYRLESAESGVVTRLSGDAPTAWDSVGVITVTYTAGEVRATDQTGVLALVRHLWTTQRGIVSAAPGDDGWTPGISHSIPRRVEELWGLDYVGGVA